MFITKILKIRDWKSRFIQDRTLLLRDIIKSFILKLPFQNVTSFGAIKMYERKKPGVKELLDACLTGGGGLCGHSNYFLKLVLDSLGYQTQIVSAVFRRTRIPRSHLAMLVKIPYTRPTTSLLGLPCPAEKLYFVDVGCGVPLHEPILLSELPYVGRAGGLEFRYELSGDGHMNRVNLNGDALVGSKPSTFASPQDYTINLTPEGRLQDFDPGFHEVYRSYDSIYLHQGFYIFRYLDISDNDFSVVWVRGKELILATRETRTVTAFDDIRQLQPIIHEYFPMISRQEVEYSIQNFNIFKTERERKKSVIV